MLLDKSIKTLSSLLKKKEISSEELVKEHINTTNKVESDINTFIELKEEEKLLESAKQSDKSRDKNSSLLHGIPFSVKDAYVTRDMQTTAASHVLDKFNPPYNATVVKKLNDAGGVLVGKNNLDAWGHGGSTENTDYGVTKNPWNTNHIPGGSSGGPAAAISSRLVSYSIGEDTGGSIRCPASMCGISGLKVTYGRVSRYGSIAYASSLDSVGPMAKSAEDLAYILEEIAGKDPLDATSSSKPIDKYSESLNNSIKGKVVGVPKEFFSEGLDSEVKKIIFNAIKKLEEIGTKTVEVSIPSAVYGVSIYYLTALSETSSNLARYDGIRYGNQREEFSPETTRRLMLGTYALSAGYADELYKRGQKARMLLIKEYNEAFEKCDVIMSPINPSPPAEFGSLINDPVKNLLEDLYTGPINIIGSPSLALPGGFTKNKLPIGFQLIGKKFHESELLNIGHQYQQATDWHTMKPPIIAGVK